MELKLKRPIVFLDLETTGVDPAKDRIVEISLVKVQPDGSKEVKTRRINPGMPIPPESTAIHGIADDDVKDEPRFEQIAKSLAAYMEGCDLAGYNSNRFDIPVLAEEFPACRSGCGFEKAEIHRRAEHLPQDGTAYARRRLPFLLRPGAGGSPFGRSRYAGYLRGAEGTARPVSRTGKRRGVPWPNLPSRTAVRTMPAVSFMIRTGWRSSVSESTGGVRWRRSSGRSRGTIRG